MFVLLVVYISKYHKNSSDVGVDSSDVVVGGFELRFNLSVNVVDCVVEVIFFYIRQGRRYRRYNRKSFSEGCRAGSCVSGGIHCEEYELVGIVG